MIHAYVLVLIFNLHTPTANSSMQEFKSRKSCLAAGVYLKHQLPNELSFVCVEK